ncbi:MAG: HAD family phosphatase [Alloprevotella sp.]|nr:HAD family phosphatase [Alloprevotella sp.]
MQTAFLFDCDGVVLDTEPQYSRFWERIGRARFPADAEFAQRIKGQTLMAIKQRYFATAPADLAWIDSELETYELQMDYAYVPGSRSFLEACRAAGFPTALVTSSDRAKMARVGRARPEFHTLFDRVFTAEDAPRSKPAPDCYLAAARHFGLEPGRCVVMEDSLNGLRAARQSGAHVVGLATGLPEAELAPWCDLVLPSLHGLSPGDVLSRLRM